MLAKIEADLATAGPRPLHDTGYREFTLCVEDLSRRDQACLTRPWRKPDSNLRSLPPFRRTGNSTEREDLMPEDKRRSLETEASLARNRRFESKWGGRPPLLPSPLRIGSARQH